VNEKKISQASRHITHQNMLVGKGCEKSSRAWRDMGGAKHDKHTIQLRKTNLCKELKISSFWTGEGGNQLGRNDALQKLNNFGGASSLDKM